MGGNYYFKKVKSRVPPCKKINVINLKNVELNLEWIELVRATRSIYNIDKSLSIKSFNHFISYTLYIYQLSLSIKKVKEF